MLFQIYKNPQNPKNSAEDPTLKNNSVDKTDGFQLYLSLESLDADIVTAKVSEVGFRS